MLLSPAFPASGPKAFLLSSPEPLLTFLSMNRNSPASPSHMCFMPTFEDNQRDFAESNCSPPWNGFSAEDCQGGAQCMHAHATTTSSYLPDHTSALNQASQIHTVGTIEEGLRIRSLWNISQNAALVDQASRLRKRLSVMLGEHASRHYSHQIEGLRKKLLEISPMVSDDLTGNVIFSDVRMQEGEDEALRRTHRYQTHRRSLKFRDLENLGRCGHAVLHEVLGSLDSDATVSSSSDEEGDHGDAKLWTSAASQCHSCEWRWLQDRAELCSRWTWLQMRLTELNSQIQQLGELHQQIIANKGRVVLAKSQPLTDRQIQHTLWTETMDLSFSAGNLQDFSSDLDMEPCSPSRLLRNIERQSAQLTQIVNSLMPPLCPSPSSSPVPKEPYSHRRDHQKISYNRQVQAYPSVLDKPGRKRKQTCHRRQWPLHLGATCVSARTRPLLTSHKPCLFIMNPLSHKEQVLDSFPSLCPSVSCDPTTSCTDPTCQRRKETVAGKMHPVLSLSSDTPSSFHLQNAVCTENFLQKSLFLKTDLLRPQHRHSSRCRVSRSLFHCNHRPKNSRHLKSLRRESTPIRWPCNRNHHRKAHMEGKRKKCSSEWPMDVTQWSDQFSLSDGNLTEQCSGDLTDCRPRHQGNSQFSCRSRSAESIFTIDDIVIPMSLVSSVKLEKLQYKNILTPSWRKVDISSLLNTEEDEHPGESEPITDEDISQRHKRYEHREKLHWSSSRRYSIRSSRKSCSAVSGKDHPAHCYPPVDFPAPSTRTSSLSKDQTEASVDDREPLPPWERRVFPLSDEDEKVLRLREHQSTTSGIGDQEMTSHCERISALKEVPKSFYMS